MSKYIKQLGGAPETSSGLSIFPLSATVDNVTIAKDDIKFVSGTGKDNLPFEAIEIQLAKGDAKIRDRIFAVNESKLRGFNSSLTGPELNEKIDSAYTNKMTRMLHYLTKYGITKEQTIEFFGKKTQNTDGGFTVIGNAFVELLRSKVDNRPLYAKTIRNKNGYVDLPAYAGFLQEMSSGECTFKYSDDEVNKNAQYTKGNKSGSTANGTPVSSDTEEVYEELDL